MTVQHVTHINFMAYPKEWFLEGPALISLVYSRKPSRHISGQACRVLQIFCSVSHKLEKCNCSEYILEP